MPKFRKRPIIPIISIFQIAAAEETFHFIAVTHVPLKMDHFPDFPRPFSVRRGGALIFLAHRDLSKKLVYPEKPFFDIILGLEKEARRLGAGHVHRTKEGSSSSLRASSTFAGHASSGDWCWRRSAARRRFLMCIAASIERFVAALNRDSTNTIRVKA
jgi:hypothetical protein